QLQVFRNAAGAAAIIKGHHEHAHEEHSRDGADPVEMRSHDAVFGARCAHADHFLRAEIRGDKRETGNPDGNRAAGSEEIFAGRYPAFDEPTNAEHEDEIQSQYDVVDRRECQDRDYSTNVKTITSRFIRPAMPSRD